MSIIKNNDIEVWTLIYEALDLEIDRFLEKICDLVVQFLSCRSFRIVF